MTQTVTETEELQLVSIITISETKLTRNFELLMKQLKRANQRIDALDTRIQSNRAQSNTFYEELRANGHQVQGKIVDIYTEIEMVANNLTTLSTDLSIKNGEQNIKLVELELGNKQLGSKIESVGQALGATIQGVQNEQERMEETIKAGSVKQNFNVEKLQKEVGLLIMKNESMNKKEKVAQERIESLEKQMTGEETGRLQEIIAEKVVKQLRKTPIGISNRDLSKGIMRKEVKIREESEESKGLLSSEMMISSKEQKGVSMKTLEKRNSVMRDNGDGGFLPNFMQQDQQEEYIDISDLRASFDHIRSKIKNLELSGSEPLSVLLETFKKDILDMKSYNEEVKREINKIKSESSAVNLTQKIQELRPQLNKVWGVIAGAEDKNIFLQRKLDQMKKTLGEVTVYVKQNNVNRYDQKVRILQTDFFSQMKEITAKLQLKTNSSDFFKFCHENQEVIKQIKTSLSSKCEKIQVKKALLFIQSKIKQIILVISEDEEYEKDALLTKKQIKCVSCDKELDKQNGLVNSDPKNWNMMPQKEMHPESFGKCGISRFGSLAAKIRKLEGSQLPVLKSKKRDGEKGKQNAE